MFTFSSRIKGHIHVICCQCFPSPVFGIGFTFRTSGPARRSPGPACGALPHPARSRGPAEVWAPRRPSRSPYTRPLVQQHLLRHTRQEPAHVPGRRFQVCREPKAVRSRGEGAIVSRGAAGQWPRSPASPHPLPLLLHPGARLTHSSVFSVLPPTWLRGHPGQGPRSKHHPHTPWPPQAPPGPGSRTHAAADQAFNTSAHSHFQSDPNLPDPCPHHWARC